jgi:hypothetical protein
MFANWQPTTALGTIGDGLSLVSQAHRAARGGQGEPPSQGPNNFLTKG